MFKKIIFILILGIFLSSCGDTLDSVKRGLTGAKAKSTDEFFIKKKDPLILPPDFENLPAPGETVTVTEEVSDFETDSVDRRTTSDKRGTLSKTLPPGRSPLNFYKDILKHRKENID